MNLANFATLASLVLTSFVATNLDNLLVLVLLLGSSAQRRAAVLLGFLTSVILVVSVAAIGVAVGALVDPSLVGYLGIAPIMMACYLLYQQRKPAPAAGDPAAGIGAEAETSLQGVAGEGRIWLTSTLLMFSNSGDSIAVLLPLVAESGRTALLLIVSLYLMTGLLWCALAVVIAARPGLARRIQQRGVRLVPWIMIAVGVYVLLDTGTDTLL